MQAITSKSISPKIKGASILVSFTFTKIPLKG